MAGEMANAGWSALGTTALVRAPRGELRIAQRAAARIVERVDRLASRFRPDSELTALNASAGSWTTISAGLADLVGCALTAAAASQGTVDPTLGHELAVLGYDRDWSELTAVDPGCPLGDRPADDAPDRGQPWRRIELQRERGLVRLPSGVRLDLGATAKGRAADLACAAAHRATGGPVLVSLGGDIAVAGEPPPEGWTIGIADDHRTRARDCAEAVRIRSGGMATSSLLVRRWWHGESPVHHVLDPRTGRPVAPCWRTVSVVAGTCADANVAATAALVLGERAPAWLQERALPARLVAADGRTVVRVAGWPA